MIAEILSVGTELLMGQISNTDAQYLSRRLSELGVTLYRHTTVGDNPGRVKEALNEALSRADMVITTGGLGPTEDDLTKEMVGEFFGLPMELHAPSLEAIRTRMQRIGREMTQNNIKQAYFPHGAIVLPQPVRYRAGMHCRKRPKGRCRPARTAPRIAGYVRASTRAVSGKAQRRQDRLALSAGVRRGGIEGGNPSAGFVPFRQSDARALLRRGARSSRAISARVRTDEGPATPDRSPGKRKSGKGWARRYMPRA